MKKIIAIAICVFMIASALSVCAFAAEDDASYTPLGRVDAYYEEGLFEKITWDGQLDDWADIDYIQLTADNMDAWQGTVPADFKITTYFAADEKYFYLAFWIDDDTPSAVPETVTESKDGDTFQIMFDLGGTLAESKAAQRSVIYTFSNREDGKLLFRIDPDERDDAPIFGVEYWVWADEADGTAGIHGAVSNTDSGSGWQAEIAIPWQFIFDYQYYKCAHYSALFESMTGIKDFANDRIKLEMSPDEPLSCLLNICYLDANVYNADGSYGGVAMAAGTPAEAGQMLDNSGFYPEHAGIELVITPTSEVSVTEPSQGRVYATGDDGDEDPSEGSDESNGEAGSNESAPSADNDNTEASNGENKTEASTGDSKTEEPKKGCGSVVGFGSVAVIALAVGTVAFKKKED